MSTRLWKLRYLRIAGVAAGAVAVAGAAVVVTVSAAGISLGPKPANTTVSAADARTASTACVDFMKHFAVALGKSQAEINAAFQKAIAQTLADEVKSGQITQAQADAITKKLAGRTPCTLPSKSGHENGGHKSALGAYLQQYVTAAAAALGISETQLKTDLAGGQSLSQIAAAQHVSEADFRTRVIAKLKPVLDTAVADKKLTAAQEQKIIGELQTGPLPLWSTSETHAKPTAPPTAAT